LVGNQQHEDYLRGRIARVEETGTLGLPGTIAAIAASRLRENPKLRY
jgi:hypothetical protein